MFALIVHCIFWLAIALRTDVERRMLGPRHDCKSCGYDLSGLPEESLCPECGAGQGDRTVVVTRTRIRIRLERIHLLPYTMLVAVMYAGFGHYLAERLAVYSYQVSGYSLAVSTAAAHHRDLRADNWGYILIPVGPAIALSPLLAIIRSRFWGPMTFFAVLVMASLAAVGAWTLPYMKW